MSKTEIKTTEDRILHLAALPIKVEDVNSREAKFMIFDSPNSEWSEVTIRLGLKNWEVHVWLSIDGVLFDEGPLQKESKLPRVWSNLQSLQMEQEDRKRETAREKASKLFS